MASIFKFFNFMDFPLHTAATIALLTVLWWQTKLYLLSDDVTVRIVHEMLHNLDK
ncbi:unnamed protein product, partial [Allacma fusca]